MKFLGQKLKTLRESKKLSMTDLYKLSEIKPGYISEIENGKKQPSDKIVKKLCAALNIDEVYFYLEESRLFTELFPGNPQVEKETIEGSHTPYAVVTEKAARNGIPPEVLDKLLDIIINNKK